MLFEEHSSSFSSPYLFNGKELDRETNLSYYGARYLDMKTSLWLNVDPLAEKLANYGAYVYTFNNPIRFTDPTGMIAEPPTGVDAEDGAIHIDSSSSWKYDNASTTWVGQKDKNCVKSKDLGNTIELDNVNVKGYKSNYVSSGDFGPSYGREKDLQYSLMLVGAIAAPILAVEGALAAGGSYLLERGQQQLYLK
ncbi:hypothetical protein J3S90_01110 [Flavobacterium sp. P4023]|uniref:RHS repeat-associated core domain-containing protein n=1 Tax=Flavobacterium flabelliforme TaxID=2816119 RepID=A0ABS5CP54_9FLAO|nr:RHS repeat-associated core domain-containing protein [Flavobacterium flabelliforme]MBP4140399.1 hypothetical protein [Flavobacterium flabelliforme]